MQSSGADLSPSVPREVRARTASVLVLLLAGVSVGRAQELEPRAYSPSPVGLNFVVLGYGHTTGGVLFDPSLPFSDVEARLNAGVIGYARTFDVFNRAASATLALPYVWGGVEGNVGEDRRAVSRSGPGDARFRFAVNLIGDPAMTPAEFAKRTPRTTLGASLVVVAPVGEYFSDKLINIGSNRWAFKPELGLSQPLGRWNFDAYAGVWLFTDNDNFFGGSRREQDPLSSFQVHVSYSFRPRLWLAADATYYTGGRTTLDGVQKADRQSNSRIGLTMSLPIGKGQSLKLNWSEGASTRIGGDFTTIGVAWQWAWFD
jgi:hypothetical protein